MKALKLEGAHYRTITIENKLEALQEAVRGYIETITLIPDKAVMIVNEEGRILGMAANHAASTIAGGLIVGPAIVVGVDGEDFCDVPEDVVQRIIVMLT